MTSNTRQALRTLQKKGDLDALQIYCQELLFAETDALLRGCLLWNLSDVYAMRRDFEALYGNHKQFEAYINTLTPIYRLWLVCDATQRLTLELGGYDGFWWEMYEKAAAQYAHTCEAVLFEAHRAAFYKSPQMLYNHTRAVWVNDRFSEFLKQTRHSPSAAFYNVIYTALCIRHFGEAEQDILTCCEPFLDALRHPANEPLYAAGEWDAFNRHRSSAEQAQVAINNAVNALIDSGDAKRARTLYTAARENGLRANHYIERGLYTPRGGIAPAAGAAYILFAFTNNSSKSSKFAYYSEAKTAASAALAASMGFKQLMPPKAVYIIKDD